MDDDEEDNYVFYGTPLPEIEDEYILQKRAARELEVRDEKGRKRFHGAFTGGFSAGYFNTVGTKEGWEPSTFISSRNKIADRVQQNPEDFMDDEDLGEFGISTRKIHTSDKFKDSSVIETRKRKFGELDSVIPGEAPLKDLVKPVSNSIGVQILIKLGWRPGQGIGPRVKKQTSGVKVYGCSLPDSLPEEEDPYALAYTFAPEDINAGFYKPKDNTFGLGYTGLSKESVLSTHIDEYNPTFTKTYLKKDKKKLTISGQAFGVGAFEDDDEDIYSKDDMSQYDFSDLDNKSDKLSITYDSKVNKEISNVLEGFCLASHPPVTKQYYPPPELPPNYKPKCALSKKSYQSECGFTPRHKLTAGERSYLLGEKKFESFSLKPAVLPAKENKLVAQSRVEISKPVNSTHTFKPFPNDSAKQNRYEEYLKLKNSGEIEKLVQPSSMTEWEKQQELEEFARSAILFKPLSTALSSKFESRSHLSVEHEVMEALEKAKNEKKQKPLLKKKLIGLKNRKSFEWHPSSLLCKRFNVPNPYPNSEPSNVSASHKSKSLFDHIFFEQPSSEKNDLVPSCSSAVSSQTELTGNPEEFSKESLIEQATNPEVSASKQEVSLFENKKPPIDFFKEIFENTSSEDEEKEEDINTNEKLDSSSTLVAENKTVEQFDKSVNKISNIASQEEKMVPKRSGFGVFANIDLDALNNRTVSKCESKKSTEEKQETEDITVASIESSTFSEVENNAVDKQNDLYGPELPPNYSEIANIEVHKSYSKKHKEKHKHKHSKHKSKKKKKKKSHKSSDDYSSDSNEDIPPEIILEKLKKLQKKL